MEEAAAHLALPALASRPLALEQPVALVREPLAVFLVLLASWQRGRVAVLVAARRVRRVVHRAHSSIPLVLRVGAVLVAVLADAHSLVTVA
jgi:hypothetical protein